MCPIRPRWSNAPNPTADELVVLMPGQSITASYELSSAFDLSSGGSFEVSFGAVAQNAATSNVQPSEKHQHWRRGNPFRDIITDIDYSKAAGAGGISYTGKCTASQKSSLVTALGNALVYPMAPKLPDQHHAVGNAALQHLVRHLFVGELEYGEVALHQHFKRVQHAADCV